MLSVYLEVIRIRFLMMLAYRVNYYSGVVIYSLNIGVYYFFVECCLWWGNEFKWDDSCSDVYLYRHLVDVTSFLF